MEKQLYAPYKAAYGKGENSYLFFGNSGEKPSTGQIFVDNGQLTAQNGDKLVFVKKMRRTHSLANRFRGNETHFRTTLPPREPVLYETVCAIGNAPDRMDLLARSQKDLDKEFYTVKIVKSPEFTGTIKIRDIRGMTGVIKLNGNVIAPATPVKMKAGDLITAEYTSKLFALKRADIRNFPFTGRKKEITCQVWHSADDKNAAAAADRIRLFFEFLQKKNLISSKAALNITTDPALRNATGVISLDSTASTERIALTPAGGIAVFSQGEALEKTVEKLLDLMDERYPYIFPFSACAGMPLEVLKHFDMNGKSLPLRKFFD